MNLGSNIELEWRLYPTSFNKHLPLRCLRSLALSVNLLRKFGN